MRPIQNWDKIQPAQEGGNRLPVGGYIVQIKNIEDVPNKEYLKIAFDISFGDYSGHYTEAFKRVRKSNPDATWFSEAILYRSYKESAESFFKGFITSVEKSNSDFNFKECNWDEKKLIGKSFGVVMGEEEYLSNENKLKVRLRVREVCSADTILSDSYTIPGLKKLQEDNSSPFGSNSFSSNSGFDEVLPDEDIPF